MICFFLQLLHFVWKVECSSCSTKSAADAFVILACTLATPYDRGTMSWMPRVIVIDLSIQPLAKDSQNSLIDGLDTCASVGYCNDCGSCHCVMTVDIVVFDSQLCYHISLSYFSKVAWRRPETFFIGLSVTFAIWTLRLRAHLARPPGSRCWRKAENGCVHLWVDNRLCCTRSKVETLCFFRSFFFPHITSNVVL